MKNFLQEQCFVIMGNSSTFTKQSEKKKEKGRKKNKTKAIK